MSWCRVDKLHDRTCGGIMGNPVGACEGPSDMSPRARCTFALSLSLSVSLSLVEMNACRHLWWPVITNYNPFRTALWVKLSIDWARPVPNTCVETTSVNPPLASSSHPLVLVTSPPIIRRNCSRAHNAGGIACNALQSVASTIHTQWYLDYSPSFF